MYPTRHVDFETASQHGRFARHLVGLKSGISGPVWNRIGAGLTEGDPLADAVFAELRDLGSTVRASFQLAARDGRSALAPADRERMPALATFFEEVEETPEWVDRGLVDLGRRVIDRCHPVPYYVLRNMGLHAGYVWSDLNKPLLMTGALKGGTRRRQAQTMGWFSDCVSPGGLDVGGSGYCATLHVRLLHASVRSRLVGRSDWDENEMGLPINQTDMAATWLAFSVVLLAGARLMGVRVSKREALAVMHLWRYACWLMGVDAAWLTDDESAGRRLLFQITSTYRGANEDSRSLGVALDAATQQIPYPAFQSIAWRFERAKHRSVASMVLGPAGMRSLGLPPLTLPWYPAAAFAWSTIRSTVLGWETPLQAAAESRGQEGRDALVRLHFAGEEKDLA
ncbi:MAG: hypothetical protein ACJAYU_004030 [Bradymonadia bacterium]|jgi:hypothetical protein